MELKKATLVEIDASANAQPIGSPIPVQFNPTSLRLQMSNRSEGGEQSGRQARQYVGSGSTTLSLELVFDTADEGQTDQPRPVLERTREVEYFIKPKGPAGDTHAPPRVRFEWAQLSVDGVVESLNTDLDLFAADGTPLRAKVTLSIKAQDPAYQLNQVGPGAANTAGAPTPGAAGAGLPGANGSALSNALNGLLNNPLTNALNGLSAALDNKVLRALDGESLAQLAQRAGLDPNAWRALAAGIGNPLALAVGKEIPVGGNHVALGLGAASGVGSGTGQSEAARVGLAAASAGGVNSALAQGYALASAGGLGAGLARVRTENAQQHSGAAKQAFPAASGPAQAAANPFASAAATVGQRNTVFSLRADERAATFGAGVPLRTTVGAAVETRANLLSGQALAKTAANEGMPPATSNPGVPGWVALPKSGQAAGAAVKRKCGCGCGCK